MLLKRGNTYKLIAIINNIDTEDISKIVFKFNDIEKTYISNEESDVELTENDEFIIRFTQEDTLKLKGLVRYEVAIKFTDNEVKRSAIKQTTSLDTIIEKEI